MMAKIDIKKDDKFILHSSDGNNYKILIYNINYYRPPEEVYAILLVDSHIDDLFFVGKDFFEKNKEKLERI